MYGNRHCRTASGLSPRKLKELETKLLTAKDRLNELEFGLFTELRDRIAKDVGRIQASSHTVAELDALCSLAETAVKKQLLQAGDRRLRRDRHRDGRHPVVEVMQTDALFVPNDTFMDTDSARRSS
jgi:DNA mismatch repair protein MutS